MTQQLPNSLFAPSWTMSQSYTLTVVDSAHGGGHSVVINPVNAGPSGTVFRNFLAKTGGGGTSDADTLSFLAHLQTQLGALWTFSYLIAQNLVQITYTGTGTGSITWDGSSGGVVGSEIGFTGNVPLTIGSGLSVVGDHPPCHVIVSASRENDTDWSPMSQRLSGDTLPTGATIVIGDPRRVIARTFGFGFHPADYATQQTVPGLTNSPMRPPIARLQLPSNSPGQAPPWTILDLISIATASRDVGAIWDNLQAFTPGTAFDVVQIDPATLAASMPTHLSIPNFATWVEMPKVTMLLQRQES